MRKSTWFNKSFFSLQELFLICTLPEMINNIETPIAIAFFGSIVIAIGKAIFLLIDKLLLLLLVLLIEMFSVLCSATIEKTIAIAPFWHYRCWYC